MTAPATIVLMRFREQDATVLPSDEIGSVSDLNVDTGLSLPPVVDAFTGKGRAFSNGFALDALDVVPGASLATRDLTIQALVSWDIAAQNSYGQTGTVVARGKGGSSSEYVAYALELRVVNAALGIGELRLWWQDSSGNVKVQTGGQFIAPAASSFMLLTAVRRWISTTSVELRYYIGDRLVGDFVSSDGDVAGGTTGTFCVGTRYSAGTAGKFLCGTIDEMRVVNYELAAEEIAATWDRISRLQPRGYKAIRDLLQPGAPISDAPTSRIQKLLRIAGHGLGYAAAQAENVRKNQLPHRAFGPVLEEWEQIAQEAPKAADSIVARRKRVLSHFRQRNGVSVPGVQATVADLLALAPSQMQIIAFDQTIRDDFSAGVSTTRWMTTPPAQWTSSAGALRVQAANGASIPYDGSSRSWYTCLANVGGSRANPNLNISNANFDGAGVHFLAKLAPTTLPLGGEVGVVFYDLALGNALLFGLRHDPGGGTYQLITEAFRKGISQGVTVQATSALVTHWLHLYQLSTNFSLLAFGHRLFNAAWSTTSSTTGYTTSPSIDHIGEFHWMGFYARSVGGSPLPAAIDVSLDDVIMRSPNSTRSLRFYVYRDPPQPGSPDIAAAERALQRLKQAHTDAHVTQSLGFKATDPYSLAGRTPTTY